MVVDGRILFHSVSVYDEGGLYSWVMELSLISEDLEYTKNRDYDVIAVYRVKDGRYLDTQKEDSLDILWELEETIKKVQQQIGELKEEVNE